MKNALRTVVTVATVALLSTFPLAASANERIVASENAADYVQEFQVDPTRSPEVDGVGGFTPEEVAERQELAKSINNLGEPKEIVQPGEMYSDKVSLPPEITKEEADVVETQIAQQKNKAHTFANAPRCKTFWPSSIQVCGAILDKYEQMGGPSSFVLWPVEPMSANPDGTGYRMRFQNGFIYWHPEAGAHSVPTHIAANWKNNGWEAGWLGYPKTDEDPISADGQGRRQEFQGGYIYKSPRFQVSSIKGKIYEYWQGQNAHNGYLGYPLADEATTPDGQGKFSAFERGYVYWHPSAGAHGVTSLMFEAWAKKGYEAGNLGYPVGDRYINNSQEIVQDFQNGQINLTAEMKNAGETQIAGQPVNNLVLAALQRYANSIGANLETLLATQPASAMAAATNERAVTLGGTYDGGVPVPPGYEYDPNRGSLHDYCTKSPDQFPSPGKNADFSGPCAIHDMCYADADNLHGGSSWAFSQCNVDLYNNIQTVCANVYGPYDLRYSPCMDTGLVYFDAVTVFHPSQWPGYHSPWAQ
ncbi:hypothetical protein WG915_11305 [Corynebacterium sp. H128]|uniref:LGFP repeat-containing protein n=1 Tax=unclassified Corynebacterium TaxID=2624378 RepID=UPI0030A7AC90